MKAEIKYIDTKTGKVKDVKYIKDTFNGFIEGTEDYCVLEMVRQNVIGKYNGFTCEFTDERMQDKYISLIRQTQDRFQHTIL